LKRRFVVAAVALVAVTLLAGSAGARPQGGGAPSSLTIAIQPGLGYAPLILMKNLRTIERRYPGTKVDWRVLASGTVITNGMINGDIHIGAMGTGPFLVGYARGIDWKIISALNDGDLWLMAMNPSIRTIADLRGKRIATPTATSIQAVVMRKMAEVKLGDARALDSGHISMDHPDGMQALMTGQIDAHFTSPPFQFQERARGARVIGRSYNYFGAHTFLVTAMTQKFYDDHTAFARQFYRDIQAMHELIAKNPTRAARILQQDAGGNPTWRQFKQWLGNPALKWTTRPRGMMRTANFMRRTNQLTGRIPRNWREIVFPPVFPTRGS